jgi:tripartite-type tricarboxylate transporter receptor subunit TctC
MIKTASSLSSLALVLIATSLAGTGALAQTKPQAYPDKPLTLIIPNAAESAADDLARLIGERLGSVLGQPVQFDNVAGANGTLGAARAAKANVDGYSLMLGTLNTHSSAPALYPNLAYDPIKDFDPVGLIATSPFVIIANRGNEAKDFRALSAKIKAGGEQITLAHAGIGTSSYMAGLYLSSLMGAHPKMVAYNGSGPAMNDLVAAEVEVMSDQLTNVMPQISAGAVRAYGIGAPRRLAILPDVPPVQDQGLKGFAASGWYGLFVPHGTAKDMIGKLNTALGKVLDQPQIRDSLNEMGALVPEKANRTPAALQKYVASELGRWTPLLKSAGAIAPQPISPTSLPVGTTAPMPPANVQHVIPAETANPTPPASAATPAPLTAPAPAPTLSK